MFASMKLTSEQIKKLISDKATELGFVKTGFAKAEILEKESSHLREWLDSGYDADMKWIEKGFEKRKDIRIILPEAKSVISLAYNYYTPYQHETDKPKVSRYAWGKDYHKIIKIKLREICELIDSFNPSDKKRNFISYVDDGPVMDKVWAVRSGIGWLGKHTNVINPEYGSWIFLCEIITNFEFGNYDSPLEDLCGSCSLCIDACPTGAIFRDYRVDANRCISYHTIENRGDIPENINLDGWIFGCDVCQDVCPFNQHPIYTSDINFQPKPEIYSPLEKGDKGGCFKSKKELQSITEKEFKEIFSNSPIKRTKFEGWKRNLSKI